MRQAETLLPSCGVAVSVVAPEQLLTVTCTQVRVDKRTPAEGDLVTAVAILFKQEITGLTPLAGKTLHYRVMKGLDILAEGSSTTDSNGQISFSFTVNEPGTFRFLASFFGENPELPDTPTRWLGCREVSCAVGPGDILPPGGVGDIGDIGIRGGGIIAPLIQPGLNQPFCGIGCGQNINQGVDGPEQGINWNLQGLEPD